jgi:putative methionine-R-sulfoxide reductase with GAF domain
MVSAAAYNLPNYFQKLVVSHNLCLGAEAIKSKKPVIINDYPYYKPRVPIATGVTLKALATAPIFMEEKGIGAIAVMSFSSQKRFSEQDAEKLKQFADQLSKMTVEKKAV